MAIQHRGPLENLEYRHLIDFVRPRQCKTSASLKKQHLASQSSISGNEARLFYEELCKESVTQDKTNSSGLETFCDTRQRGKHSKREYKRQVLDLQSVTAGTAAVIPACSTSCGTSKLNQRVLDHKKSELLRLAQSGDDEGVKTLVQQGIDVNGVDHFGWTALMSASYEGHIDVVRTLIQCGADLTVSSRQGQTALSLAGQKRQKSVVNFIESYERRGIAAFKSERKTEKQVVSFYCDVCKSEFRDTDRKSHNTSVVHVFNTGSKPKDDSFLIPPSNVGYRLMLKTGWDGNRGLGPCGHGRKFPLRTLLKRDRKGLGSECGGKAKVTHFKAKDTSAVARAFDGYGKREANIRTLSRRAQLRKEKRDRQEEIDLRQQLS